MHDRRTTQILFCFDQVITGNKVTNTKTIPVSSLGVGFRNNYDNDDDNFSVIVNDTYRVIRPIVRLRTKVDKKHL